MKRDVQDDDDRRNFKSLMDRSFLMLKPKSLIKLKLVTSNISRSGWVCIKVTKLL
jgi:hypothetical protein